MSELIKESKSSEDNSEDNSEESEGTECVTCYDIFSGDGECKICYMPQCSKCAIEGNIINFNDCLQDCSNQCTECERIGCKDCMRTCYSCSNRGENSPMLCEDCSTYIEEDCEYHGIWILCNNCSTEDNKCGECQANKNYCGKYSMF
jgi:hypothetical protein